VVDVELAPGLRQHRVREVRNGDRQVTVPEVDPERESGRALEPDHHRRSSGVSLAVGLALALGREVALDQVGDDRRDRRTREAGDPGQLGPARHSLLAQRVDDKFAVALSQGRQRTATSPHGAYPFHNWGDLSRVRSISDGFRGYMF
jgi:hypothetical protein